MLRGSVCLLLLLVSGSILASRPRVRTSLGVLEGRALRSRDGRVYSAFTRVPFAKPPVGALRFQEPVPAEPWSGVLDATQVTPKCPQSPDGEVIGQEDCLYLEIYTPNVSASLPVLVHIFGGSFLIGPEIMETGRDMAAFFMDEDVVLVSLRYRLGILGFLSLENEEMPGNQGLKDMALALEWLQREVHNFGGNPRLVSTFGYSAGGAASHFLCISPRTRKLLKGCISGSGVAGAVWSLNERGVAKDLALKAAARFNCSQDQLVSCLRNKPLEEIIEPYEKTLNEGWQPSIEPPCRTAMITEWPPRNTDFPWVVGHVAKEGLMTSDGIRLFENSSSLKPYTEDWETYFPELLRLKPGVDNRQKAKRVHDRFFLQDDPYQAIEQFVSEGFFIYPALKEASLHNGPKYFYIFNYTGGPSLLEIVTNTDLNITGVTHCEELPYLFENPDNFRPIGWPSEKDTRLSKTLIKFWVHFAKHQTPSLGSSLLWEQFTAKRYLDIANDAIHMKNYSNVDEIIQFWDSIFH